jgi:protein-S-isoprenylcysteine O-methyltransferase Ste14
MIGTSYMTLSPRSRRLATTFGAAALWLAFLIAHASYTVRTGEAIGVTFLVQLTLITYLFIRRNEAVRSSTSTRDWVVGLIGGFGTFLVRPNDFEGFAWSGYVGVPLQVAGLLLSVVALMELGRSFGMVAADRGIVSSGPYRLVRHPAYLAYGIGEIGYLLESFSVWNLTVVLIVWVCQLDRIRAEEAVLSENPSYVAYKEKVRYALIPGVW